MRSLLQRVQDFNDTVRLGHRYIALCVCFSAARVSVCRLVLLRFVSGKINHILILVTQIVMSGRQHFCSRPELINSLKAYSLICYEISLYYTESFFFFFLSQQQSFKIFSSKLTLSSEKLLSFCTICL